MENKDFIKEVIDRIKKYSIPDIWVTDNDEIFTDSEIIHYELLNTFENLGLDSCVHSDTEMEDGVKYYGIHFG